MNPPNRRVGSPKLPLGIDADAEAPSAERPSSGSDQGEPEPRSRVIVWLKTFVGTLAAAGIAAGLGIGAHRYVTSSPRFDVSDIRVDGSRQLDEDDVITASGVGVGQNIFVVDTVAVRERLELEPWIASAHVSRKLPSSVEIQIVEREAVALVAIDKLFIASKDGEIFKAYEPGDPDDLVVVTGVSPNWVERDRAGVQNAIKHAIALAASWKEMAGHDEVRSVQEVHVSDAGDMTLVIGKSAMRVSMGKPPYRKKIERAVQVVAEVEKRGATPGVIMLDTEARTDRVVVRLK